MGAKRKSILQELKSRKMCSLKGNDCKTVGFFLKIRNEMGKAWRKSLTRAKRANLTPVGRVRREKKKPYF